MERDIRFPDSDPDGPGRCPASGAASPPLWTAPFPEGTGRRVFRCSAISAMFGLCRQDIHEYQMPALHVYFFGENGADPNCELHIPGADDSFFLISVYSFEMHRIKLLYLISFKYYIEKPHETIIDHQEQFV